MALNVASSFTNQEKILIEKARFYAQYNAVMPELVKKFTMPKGARQITINRYQNLTADALTDGVDIAAGKSLSVDTVTLTTSEYGLKVIVTEKMVREMVDNVFADTGKLMGDAMAKYRDKLILALFASVSTNTIGAAGTALTLGHLGAAVSILDATPAPGDYMGVFHSYTMKDLWDDLVDKGTDVAVPWVNLSNDMARKYIRGRDKISGIPLIVDGNITPDGDDDAVSGIFSREFAAIVTEKAWSIKKDEDISLRATEIVCVADEGVAELKDDYCVQCTFDAAQETS